MKVESFVVGEEIVSLVWRERRRGGGAFIGEGDEQLSMKGIGELESQASNHKPVGCGCLFDFFIILLYFEHYNIGSYYIILA